MLWYKEVVLATVTAGTAAANTVSLKGMIEQILVFPLSVTGSVLSTSDWSLSIIDKDSDTTRLYTSETGRVEDCISLPVGLGVSEKFTLRYTGVTGAVTTMRAILRVREN